MNAFDLATSFHDARSCNVSNPGTRCLASACAQYAVICTHSLVHLHARVDAERSTRRRHPRRALFSGPLEPVRPRSPTARLSQHRYAGPDEFRPGRRATDVERPARIGLIRAEEWPIAPFSVHGRRCRPERDGWENQTGMTRGGDKRGGARPAASGDSHDSALRIARISPANGSNAAATRTTHTLTPSRIRARLSSSSSRRGKHGAHHRRQEAGAGPPGANLPRTLAAAPRVPPRRTLSSPAAFAKRYAERGRRREVREEERGRRRSWRRATCRDV